jgi:integrase/recombinase XerD
MTMSSFSTWYMAQVTYLLSASGMERSSIDIVTISETESSTVIERRHISNEKLVELWLDGRPNSTTRRYLFWANDFAEKTRNKPLHLITLQDAQYWRASLEDLSPNSQRTAVACIKSLFTFGFELGALPFNVTKALKSPYAKDTLNERILTESEVQLMIALELQPRNKAILKLLYYGALRVSELVALTWADMAKRQEGGQVTVYGKGGKTRFILLPEQVWSDLYELRENALDADPVFRSRKRKFGGHLDPSHINKVVKTAALRAGIQKKVSPHWLRHCHASHALDRNAPPHLIRDTLGHSSLATTSRYLKGRPKESSAKFLPL